MRKKIVSAMAALLCLALLLGLAIKPAPLTLAEETEGEAMVTEYPLTMTDTAGREVTLEAEPEKIVSLGPNMTELVFALEAGERLVGRTKYCNYPEEALEVQEIGTLQDPNFELITELAPDLVLASTHVSDDTLAKLDELKRLKFLYPGQLIFCQTLLSSHQKEERYPDDEESGLISALKAGDIQKARQYFFTFAEALSHTSYAYILYSLKHLMQNIEPLAPVSEPEQELRPMEELLEAAEDVQALYARLSPGFEAIAAHQLSKKQKKVSALAERVSLRLERGWRDPTLSAQKIADEMGISAAYLRKQFFEAEGLSVNEALNRLRIGKAAELLVSTEMTVEEIAREIGFENTKYMFVLFKRMEGMTPGQYRAQASPGMTAS